MKSPRTGRHHLLDCVASLLVGVVGLVGCASNELADDQGGVVSSTATSLSSATTLPAPPTTLAVATSAAVVLGEFPHDPAAFTEGLIIDGDRFIESVGLVGSSSLRRVELATGNVESSVAIEPDKFGEGLAQLGNQLFQLTWKSELAYVYDAATFELISTRTYDGEGWGLTTNGAELVMSNGSSTITFRSPDTFAITRSIVVTDGGAPVEDLNELEMVGSELWANVWLTDLIARIDPATGTVVGWIDVAALRPASSLADRDAVANGIAYDEAANRLFVTGKRWDTVFEIAVPSGLVSE
jgi:glutaminyl-peptide cyclotransferase